MAQSFRISLLSFLLLAGLICVSVSHYRVTFDNLALQQQVADLKEELGYIHVENPKRIYLRRLESLDPTTWQFRLYLPPQSRYMLRVKTGGVTSGRSLSKFDRPFTVKFGLRKQADGRWQVRYTLPGSAGAGDVSEEFGERISDAGIHLIRGETQHFAPHAEVELMRTVDGFRIWVEPYTPRKARGKLIE